MSGGGGVGGETKGNPFWGIAFLFFVWCAGSEASGDEDDYEEAEDGVELWEYGEDHCAAEYVVAAADGCDTACADFCLADCGEECYDSHCAACAEEG